MERNYQISDKQLISNAKIYLENLKIDLDVFTTLHNKLDVAYIDKLEKFIDDLDNLTTVFQPMNDAHINELNELNNLIIEIRNVAKFIFADNPQKLNNYIKMPKIKELPVAPKGLEYFHATEEFSWEPVEGATLYQLQYTTSPINSESEWEEIVMTPVSNMLFTPEEAGDYAFRVRGFNESGFGEPSEVLEMYFGKY